MVSLAREVAGLQHQRAPQLALQVEIPLLDDRIAIIDEVVPADAQSEVRVRPADGPVGGAEREVESIRIGIAQEIDGSAAVERGDKIRGRAEAVGSRRARCTRGLES